MILFSYYFKETEFICKCGKCKAIPAALEERVQLLVDVLDIIRFYSGPIIVTSGIRCTAHNKRVGGVPDSKHLTGEAVDIYARDVNIIELWDSIAHLQKKGLITIGYRQLYKKKGFIHLDIRGIDKVKKIVYKRGADIILE